jgi:hypothetical protein
MDTGLVCSVVGSVSSQNRSRTQTPIFTDIGTETETKTENRKNRIFGSVRLGSVLFSVYGLKVPRLTVGRWPVAPLPLSPTHGWDARGGQGRVSLFSVIRSSIFMCGVRT